MAEQDLTPEQLKEIAVANEEKESDINYKPPAQKSLQEIQELDKDDESLRKYKEALLGKAAVVAGSCRTRLVYQSVWPVSSLHHRMSAVCYENKATEINILTYEYLSRLTESNDYHLLHHTNIRVLQRVCQGNQRLHLLLL